MIKTILFDYAGVLTPTRDNYDFAKQNYKRFGLEPQVLMEKTYKNFSKAVVGEISDKQFWKEVSSDLDIDPEKLKELIIETFPIDHRIIDLIDTIKGKYTIVMVSNQIASWLEKVIEDNNLRNKFNYFINSYQIGSKKPDEKIFLIALERSNSKPEETLFIDDSAKNIDAAKKLGMQTIQFGTYEQFIKEFKKYVNI